MHCCVVFSPSAHRSEDWSCPRLNTSSGDRYSTWRKRRKKRRKRISKRNNEMWKKETEKENENGIEEE
jgi:hypothetical protein